MSNVRGSLAFLTAALLLGGCTSGGSPRSAPSPSSSSPSSPPATATVAATATVRFEVTGAGAAEQPAVVLRARLDALGLAPSEPRVEGAMVTFGVARQPSDEEVAQLTRPGRLELRPVLESLPPSGSAQGAPAGDCADAAFRTAQGQRASNPKLVSARVVACDAAGDAKYVLGPAEVTGDDVRDATAQLSMAFADPPPWVVSLTMASPEKWAAVTEVYLGEQLAIAVDGVVQSAPTIQTVITDGGAEISGDFTETRARALAGALRSGPLEVQVTYRP